MLKLQGVFRPSPRRLIMPVIYRAKLFHNIERLNDVALSGYIVGGSTGESPLISTEERIQVFEWVREARAEGKLLIAGTVTEGVRETVPIVNRAAEIGYDAALVLGPRYYRNLMHRPDTQALFTARLPTRRKFRFSSTTFRTSPGTISRSKRSPRWRNIRTLSG